MARKIMFRGFRKWECDWIEGYLLDDEHIGRGNDLHPVYPETVGQFVGRCDSNDTKIFDGDIVKIMDGTGCSKPIVGVIQFENCGFFFKFGKCGKVLFGGWVTECYVIGNIHDNPELLNGKES